MNFVDLDWEEFEGLVAAVWTEFGYVTELTPPGSDGGVDVYAEREIPFQERVAIQVKKYAPENKIGVSEIREYSALSRRQDIDIVVVVTTSSFSPAAGSEAFELGVKLVDGDQFKQVVAATDLAPEFESREGPNMLLSRFREHQAKNDPTEFLEFSWNYEFNNGTHMLRLETKEQIHNLNELLAEFPNVSAQGPGVPYGKIDGHRNYHFESDRMQNTDSWSPAEEARIAKHVLSQVFSE